ncbi:MAG TPA: thermonuclease family protein [Vicinamibacterales bacterium]|nr:thermonuclease family protein [Vicinamibacterales bacterium]
MQILPTLVVLSLAILQLASSPRLVRSDPVLVRAVVDGDTIDVASVGHVRLLGIVAPALGRGSKSAEPFAAEARDRLAGILIHRWIRLEHEAGEGRAAYVMTDDGVFVNALMVREGLARVTGRASLARFGELKNAERDAQFSRRAMWSGAAQIPSASYTRKSAEGRKKKNQ